MYCGIPSESYTGVDMKQRITQQYQLMLLLRLRDERKTKAQNATELHQFALYLHVSKHVHNNMLFEVTQPLY